MDLQKDNLKKLYLRFLIPSLGSAMVMSIYTLTDALAYMRYINIFLPVAVFSNYIAIFVRADEDPNRAMALLGGVVNIVLDIVFVFPMQMGIGGAALASAIGMVIQVVVRITHFLSKKNKLKFILLKHVASSIAQIIGNGVPSFFNEFASGFIGCSFAKKSTCQ